MAFLTFLLFYIWFLKETNQLQCYDCPFGYLGDCCLYVRGTRYYHSETMDSNKIRLIECDIEEKWMKVKESQEDNVELNELN